MNYCPLCNSYQISFKKLPDFYYESAIKFGYKYFGQGEMISLEKYSCSVCGASDRERIYALWIKQEVEMGILKKNCSLIHFAPEPALSKFIKSLNWFQYKTADYLMDNVDFQVNLMELPFPDGSFDFFICSHVLEHVEDDRQSIRELFRITSKGGRGILVSPIIVGLENSLEDPAITSPEDRWRFFGQNDHLRLYSHNDFLKRIQESGFSVFQLGIDYFGEAVFEMLGLKRTSILYIVYK